MQGIDGYSDQRSSDVPSPFNEMYNQTTRDNTFNESPLEFQMEYQADNYENTDLIGINRTSSAPAEKAPQFASKPYLTNFND